MEEHTPAYSLAQTPAYSLARELPPRHQLTICR